MLFVVCFICFLKTIKTINLIIFYFSKMACTNCSKNNNEAFEKPACVFPSRRPLVLSLLNVVLNIKDIWASYCFCTDGSFQCAVCQFRTVYLNDEYDIYENCFDLNFLSKFHDHMYNNLKRLLLEIDLNNYHFACELINRKFFYTYKNWYTGDIEHYYLTSCLQFYEDQQMKKIKNHEFKVVLNPIFL